MQLADARGRASEDSDSKKRSFRIASAGRQRTHPNFPPPAAWMRPHIDISLPHIDKFFTTRRSLLENLVLLSFVPPPATPRRELTRLAIDAAGCKRKK
jgi:hypothetical protein